MPNLFSAGGYKVFFWSGDMFEPIHVHVSTGHPTPNATKIWLTKDGRCILAHNRSDIPKKDLNDLMDLISAQFFYICDEWKKFYVTDAITFLC